MQKSSSESKDQSMRDTPPTPVFYGQIHFGTFRNPFETVNLIEADIYGHHWTPRWWRSYRLKEWYRLHIMTEELYGGIELFDAKVLALASAFLYDKNTLIDHQRSTVQHGAIRLPEQSLHGTGFFRQSGFQIRIENHHITVAIRDRRTPIQADIELVNDPQIQPLITVLPVNNYRRPLYTHKTISPVKGYIRVGKREISLDGQAWIEAHKAFYPRDAHLMEFTLIGNPVTVSLRRSVIRDDERWNECCAWIDGRLNLLGAARFERDQGWRVWTTDGRAEFTLVPVQERLRTAQLGKLFHSESRQWLGEIQGYVIDDEGKRHEMQNAFGLINDQHVT
jgi:hypothetical protein